MTIPTISEIKGNTILQLLTNVYNTLKNAILGKQDTLVAGDNIIIDKDTNRISAILGGQPVLDDYYTKTEVDTIVSDVENDFIVELDNKADKLDTYTKTETDNLLNEKANSINVYNKVETNELLDEKADKADVYSKTDVYTKTETNGLLSAKADTSNVYPKSDTYNKGEINTLLDLKANSDDVYTKNEVDALIPLSITNATITQDTNKISIAEDIVSSDYLLIDARFAIIDGTNKVLNITCIIGADGVYRNFVVGCRSAGAIHEYIAEVRYNNNSISLGVYKANMSVTFPVTFIGTSRVKIIRGW